MPIYRNLERNYIAPFYFSLSEKFIILLKFILSTAINFENRYIKKNSISAQTISIAFPLTIRSLKA